MSRPVLRPRLAPVLLMLALIAGYGGCAAEEKKHSANPWDDPFDDPFFREEGLSLNNDEYLKQGAPSVGSLSPEEDEEVRLRAERQALRDAGFTAHGRYQETNPDDEADSGKPQEKSFSDKAEEASVATMSILVGLGMTALPFLLPGL